MVTRNHEKGARIFHIRSIRRIKAVHKVRLSASNESENDFSKNLSLKASEPGKRAKNRDVMNVALRKSEENETGKDLVDSCLRPLFAMQNREKRIIHGRIKFSKDNAHNNIFLKICFRLSCSHFKGFLTLPMGGPLFAAYEKQKF